MVERSLSMREVPGSIPGASTTFEIFLFEQLAKKSLHRPGIEPGPPAWQASILPLNQRCFLTIICKNLWYIAFSCLAQITAKEKIDGLIFLNLHILRVDILLALDATFVMKSFLACASKGCSRLVAAASKNSS